MQRSGRREDKGRPVKNQGMPLAHWNKRGGRGVSHGWRAGGFSWAEEWPDWATSLLRRFGTSLCLCLCQRSRDLTRRAPQGPWLSGLCSQELNLRDVIEPSHLGNHFSPLPNFCEAGVDRRRMWLLLLKEDTTSKAQGHLHISSPTSPL